MKISIITAVFNCSKTIERAINSIKNQTYKNIELIIIDGGSTDGTIEAIENLIDKNDIFISESDNGIYDALNKGIRIASGQIIGFLHADDLYEDSDVISKVFKVFNKHKCDIVYGDASYFSPDKTSKVVRKYKSDQLTKKNLAWGKMPVHPSIFIKKKVYDKHGYFKTEFKIAGDYEFLCRIINDKSISTSYVSSNFVLMQQGGISTTRTIKNTILLNKEVYRAIKENNIYTNIFMLLSRYISKILQLIKK